MYTISISVRAFFPVRGTDRYPSGLKEAGLRMLVPIGFFAFLNIMFGVWSGPIMDFIGRIAAGLI
jgi:multicomponent Na+:H+ antiporter subunit D